MMAVKERAGGHSMWKLLKVLIFAAFSTGCARIPQTLEVTNLQGVNRPYYQEGEAMALRLGWDYFHDADKIIECSFADSFSGEMVWKGTATVPAIAYGKKLVSLDWSPPMEDGGIKAKGGEYIAFCNIGNENVLSVPVSVRTPFAMRVTDIKGDVRPYFSADEAIMLWVNWDTKHDAEKRVECSISNTFSGEQVWHGVAKTPLVASNKNFATLAWNPQYPVSGIRLKRGNYAANCNFNDKTTMAIPISVTNVKTWP